MTTHRVRLLGFTVVLFLLTVLPVLASNNIRIVRLSLVQGDVQIDRNAGDGWEQAINNMPVIAGARIYAAENSKAELEFEDGSSVRLVGPAQITMLNLSATGDGSKVNQVQVDSGQVYVNARLHHHDDFRVLAPTGEIFIVSRPSHLRFTVDEQTASLAMLDGEVSVEDGRQSKVHAGETYNYILGQPESAARQNSVPPQPADQWNQQRDAYNDQYSAAGAQPAGEDPNAPGTADLANYGQYDDIPGYGVAWQPNGVGPDWDPYSYGAWSYYPSFGWTFVSGYPWGWTPFYYGDWCYINGRGWWWRPGLGHRPGHGPGHGGGWHPRPRFTGSPSHAWNAPHPPSSRGSRGTIAVAGSHIAAGPISATHGAIVPGQHGFVDVTHTTRGGTASGFSGNGSRRTLASGSVSPRSNVAVGNPIARGTSALNPGLPRGSSPIVGQRGSYALTNDASRSGANSGRTGYEVHRPPSGYAPNGAPVRSYSPSTAAPGAVNIQRGYSAPPVSTPRAYSPAPVSAPSHVTSAPVAHGSMSPPVSSGGGGFHGGGGGGFSGGGGHAAGGGGFSGGGGHAGGGGGHR